MDVSIIIPFRNEEKYLEQCIDSILRQTYQDFELIMVDDGSTDRSAEIIQSFKDKRIKYIRNPGSGNVARARNAGIQAASGRFLFFTDADCTADESWLENGVKFFKENRCVGAEGQLYYVAKDYRTTLADQLTVDVATPGQWMAGNVAYTKAVLDKAGMFSPEYKYMQDRELALRIKRYGEIGYCKEMVVTHLKKAWSCKGFFNNARRMVYKILLYKQYGREGFKLTICCRIVNPINLLKILIPPLAYLPLLIKRQFRTWEDWKLFPFVYAGLIYERVLIWRTAIREKFFLI